jgi:hypothetical protein
MGCARASKKSGMSISVQPPFSHGLLLTFAKAGPHPLKNAWAGAKET